MFVMQGTPHGTEPLPQSVAERTWVRRGCGMGYPLLFLQLHSQLSQNCAVPQVWLWSLLTVRPTPEPNQPLIGLQPSLGGDASGLSLTRKEMQAGQGLLSMQNISSAGTGQAGRSSQVQG